MKYAVLLSGLSALILSGAPANGSANGMRGNQRTLAQSSSAQPSSDSKAERYRPDLALRGTLANGVRYVILHRQGREPGVGLVMHVDGGFIDERRPGERGLAHLIEHVAFDSPTEGAPDDLHHLKRIGLPLTLPAPSAASTSFGETLYYLSSRSKDLAQVDTLLTLFRDVASELTLRADAVDLQRADVVREMAEKRPGNADYASYIAAVAPGSPNDLIQGQNSDDVPTADIGTIRALYHRLYRPERTTIVVVGAVDPARIATIIAARFRSWKGIGAAPPPRPLARYNAARIQPISYAAVPGGRSGVAVSVTMPLPSLPATRGQQMQATLTDMVATAAVNLRLHRLMPNSAPGKVEITIENSDGYRMIRMLDHVAPAQWRWSVDALTRLSCDLEADGLSDAEWDSAKQRVLQDLDQRDAAMMNVPNVDLARDFGQSLAAGREVIAPSELRDHARTWLPALSSKAGNRWWRKQWRSGVRHVRVEVPELATEEDPVRAIRKSIDMHLGPKGGCKART